MRLLAVTVLVLFALSLTVRADDSGVLITGDVSSYLASQDPSRPNLVSPFSSAQPDVTSANGYQSKLMCKTDRFKSADVACGDMINQIAARLGDSCPKISETALAECTVLAESGGWVYNFASTSSAKGLMQLLKETARSVGVHDVFDPYQNLLGGMKYQRQMLSQFSCNLDTAIKAYHDGPRNVYSNKFSETPAYIAKIKSCYLKKVGGFLA